VLSSGLVSHAISTVKKQFLIFLSSLISHGLNLCLDFHIHFSRPVRYLL
jgi:hypothetical protein